VRQFAAAACLLGVTAFVPARAEAAYNLSRCAAAEDKVSLTFEGGGKRVRRVHIGPSGVELSGDIKGSSRLSMVREIQLQPKLRILYIGGQSAEFGKLTNHCAEKVRATAKALSVAIRSSDG